MEIAKKLAALAHGDNVKLPGERKEITLDSKVLSRYVGAYQLAQGPAMLITLEPLVVSVAQQRRRAINFRQRRSFPFVFGDCHRPDGAREP